MVVGISSYDHLEIYTVVFKDDFLAEYSASDNVLESLPASCPRPISSILPAWIKGGSTTTSFLSVPRFLIIPRHQVQLHDCILCHVFAHVVPFLVVPSALKHYTMLPQDKNIWGAAYDDAAATPGVLGVQQLDLGDGPVRMP